jgi:hypothetical protein
MSDEQSAAPEPDADEVDEPDADGDEQSTEEPDGDEAEGDEAEGDEQDAAEDSDGDEPERDQVGSDRLQQLDEDIDSARSTAEDADVLVDPEERHYVDSGEQEDEDDQTITPPA